MTSLLCVAPEHVADAWPIARPFIEAAYRETDRLMPDMLAWFKEGRGLLWLVAGDEVLAAVVTSLEPRPSGLVCRVVACGGEKMGDWLHLLAEIEGYARREGCVKVVLEGRRGWSRALDGYETYSVSMQKRL